MVLSAAMTVFYLFLRVQPSVDELLIVVLEISHMRVHEQHVAVFHLYDERVESIDDLLAVGDDDFFLVGHGCHIVPDERFKQGEFHHLGVHEHKFHLRGVLLVEQRGDDSVQADRFTLSRSTCYQEVRRLGKVEHKHFVGNGLAHHYRQTHLLFFLKTLTCYHRVHRHHLRTLIRHLNAYCALARNRGNDTDTIGTQREHYILLQCLNPIDASSFFRYYLV